MHAIRLGSGLTLIWLAGLAGVPSPGGAADSAFLREEVRFAEAVFVTPASADPNECLETYVGVLLEDEAAMGKFEPGKPRRLSALSGRLLIQQYDSCAGQVTGSFSCQSDEPAGSVSPSLDKADLEATMSCADDFDPTAPPVAVPVAVTWEATGAEQRRSSDERITRQGQRIHRSSGFARQPAIARGSIVWEGANLIPSESVYAFITNDEFALREWRDCRKFPEVCEADLQSLAADAVDLFTGKLDALTAEAAFYTPATGGACLEFYLDVRITDEQRYRLKEGPGRPQREPPQSSFLNISEFDVCTHQTTRFYSCQTTEPTVLEVARDLATARLAATMDCTDQLNGGAPVTDAVVDLTWTATGALEERVQRTRVSSEGAKLRIAQSNVIREATVEGSVLLGGEDVLPDDLSYAEIGAGRISLRLLYQCQKNPQLCEPPE